MPTSKDNTFQRLRHKFRLVVINDDTLQEHFSFKLSQLNLYLLLSTLLVVSTLLIFALIVFTPIKYYIPGYGDDSVRRQVLELSTVTDSLDQIITRQNDYIGNIQKILSYNGDTLAMQQADSLATLVETVADSAIYLSTLPSDTVDINRLSSAEQNLRNEIEQSDYYNLFGEGDEHLYFKGLTDVYLFPPITGHISDGFNANKEHFGIDIVAPENEAIKVIADGTVILSSWTVETGHVIAIQHDNNLLSFYKHNSVLLKKVGDFVRAGDAIAIIGSSGEHSTGPHLHFELWYKQAPVNPLEYINFN